MAKRNKAHFFHAHRAIFVDLVRPAATRQEARAVWHRMFKAKAGPVDFPRHYQRAYTAATQLLNRQMRAERKEAA